METLSIRAAFAIALLIGAGAAHAQPAAQLGEESAEAEQQRVETAEERVDRLYAELAATDDPQEGERIASQIQAEWAKSGSDSMDLLLDRARDAMTKENFLAARVHLSALTRLAPDFAEAWNASATLRYLQNDYARAAVEIERALALNPRHFSALTGLALIFQQTGRDESAMVAWREVERLYPSFERAKEAIERLAPEVDGRQL
ncbi:MAG: hypothetical protein AAFP78_11090 [Pseudomonadota bacterium]